MNFRWTHWAFIMLGCFCGILFFSYACGNKPTPRGALSMVEATPPVTPSVDPPVEGQSEVRTKDCGQKHIIVACPMGEEAPSEVSVIMEDDCGTSTHIVDAAFITQACQPPWKWEPPHEDDDFPGPPNPPYEEFDL